MADTSRHSVFCEHIGGDGATVLEHACKLGLEGIVSKRADAPYRSGTRREWVKVNATALHPPRSPRNRMRAFVQATVRRLRRIA